MLSSLSDKIKRNSVIAALIIALNLTACTIPPSPYGLVPDDSGRQVFSTDISAYIARKATCELRDAFVRSAARLLMASDEAGSQIVANELMADPDKIIAVEKHRIDPVSHVRAYLFINSFFSLKFEITVTDTNTHAGSIGLAPGTGTHAIRIGISEHKAELRRENKRVFSIAAQSVGRLQKLQCDASSAGPETPDLVYPMRGKIGLDQVVTFNIDYLTSFFNFEGGVDRKEVAREALALAYRQAYRLPAQQEATSLSRFSALRAQVASGHGPARAKDCYEAILEIAGANYASRWRDIAAITKTDNTPKMTDTMVFTTTLSGGINPSITFAGATNLSVSSLGYKMDNSRIDKHQLTVEFTPEAAKSPKVAKLQETGVSECLDAGGTPAGPSIAGAFIVRRPDPAVDELSIKNLESLRNQEVLDALIKLTE